MSKEWKKLIEMKKAKTRILSVGIKELKLVKQNPDIPLEYKWRIEEGKLILEVRERAPKESRETIDR